MLKNISSILLVCSLIECSAACIYATYHIVMKNQWFRPLPREMSIRILSNCRLSFLLVVVYYAKFDRSTSSCVDKNRGQIRSQTHWISTRKSS